MTAREIRRSFLDFFAARGHTLVPSSPVIPHGDPTLLFTNAGMNQFKDVFLGTGTRNYRRAANTQKCIRVSGKHNDLEEVGRDTYHHTFFEMLGNWSFGDYYKREAIAWGWELLTGVWRLDPGRLYATVYETDDEAARFWHSETGILPGHILRFGKKDNFWEMGDTGPCGPCSEIHMDLTPDGTGGGLVNTGDARVMEIWNLVFIQNNRNEQGELEPLPARHVDTGMGFERICAVLQGRSSNYDTDVFAPILAAVAEATGRAYGGRLEDEGDIAMRVIADHVRMLSVAVADGAVPSNEGRGYVLRRILRRAARFGRTLGMREPFLHSVTDSVVHSMGDVFPELQQRREHVARVVRAEEESFNITLDRGLQIFASVLERTPAHGIFPGEEAFRLYDTYGFPLDLTQLMAGERGLRVDTDRVAALMEEQRSRAREARSHPSLPGAAVRRGEPFPEGAEALSSFVGYTQLEVQTEILAPAPDCALLRANPFYAEAGGQVSDTGVLVRAGGEPVPVLNAGRAGGASFPILSPGHALRPGETVLARVDAARRMDIQRNHSATHLVHEALRRVLGTHVHQQGSLVAPDRLRFDFPHFGKISREEIRAVEEKVNEKIAENIRVVTQADIPVETARRIPNVKMFFGEKYGERVRVVFMDEGFSVEFCGGTHVGGTGEIGCFRIVSETGIASGVRRIEAVTGDGILRQVAQRLLKLAESDRRLQEAREELRSLLQEVQARGGTAPSGLPLPLPPPELPEDPGPRLTAVEEALRLQAAGADDLAAGIALVRKELSRLHLRDAAAILDGLVRNAVRLDDIRVACARVPAAGVEDLKTMGDRLRERLGSGVGLLASVVEGKVALVCVVTDDLVSSGRLHAGTIVGRVARTLGGGGGGKAHMATAGARETGKLDEALTGILPMIRSMLST
ncbi:MAG: alanine--tRNA ligase [Bacteroidota bacterium]